MKTQTLLSFLFVAVLLLISFVVTSHDKSDRGTYYATNMHAGNNNKTASRNAMEWDGRNAGVLFNKPLNSPDLYCEDETHILHFHYSRLKSYIRSYQLQIILCKVVLVLLHLSIILFQFRHLIEK